jgi:hypothetical protein
MRPHLMLVPKLPFPNQEFIQLSLGSFAELLTVLLPWLSSLSMAALPLQPWLRPSVMAIMDVPPSQVSTTPPLPSFCRPGSSLKILIPLFYLWILICEHPKMVRD